MPNLREINHCTLLFKEIGKFHLDPVTADVVICVENKKFPAHRLLLAAQSNFFDTLLYWGKNCNEAGQTEIILEEVTAKTFGILLEYLYKGTLSQEAQNIPTLLELLECAVRYNLKNLENDMKGRLAVNFGEKQYFGLVCKTAFLLGLNDLQKNCMFIIAMSVEGISEEGLVLDLAPEVFLLFLPRLSTAVSQIKLFDIAVTMMNRWRRAPKIFKELKQAIKKHINFGKILADQIRGSVKESGVFSSEEYAELVSKLRESGSFENFSREMDTNLVQKPAFRELEDDVFDLGDIYLINHVHFKSNGFDGFLQTSTDLMTWKSVFECESFWFSQQKDICFPEIPARYLRLYYSQPSRSETTVSQVSLLSDPQPQVKGFIWPRKNVLPNESVQVQQYFRGRRKKSYQSVKKLTCVKCKVRKTHFMAQDLKEQELPNCFRIRFSQPYLLDSCRICLWDFDGRKYRFRVLLDKTLVYDRSEQLVGGWHAIRFSPRPVKAIYIECLEATTGGQLRIAYFEAPAVE